MDLECHYLEEMSKAYKNVSSMSSLALAIYNIICRGKMGKLESTLTAIVLKACVDDAPYYFAFL